MKVCRLFERFRSNNTNTMIENNKKMLMNFFKPTLLWNVSWQGGSILASCGIFVVVVVVVRVFVKSGVTMTRTQKTTFWARGWRCYPNYGFSINWYITLSSFLMFSCLNRKSQTLFFSRNLDQPWLQNSTFIVKKWPTCKNYIPEILISVPSSVMHILAKCLHNSEKDNLVFKDEFEVL